MKEDQINQLISSIGFYIYNILTLTISQFDQELKKLDIPLVHAQFAIINTISNNDHILSQKEIADIHGKDVAAISRSLRYLEKKWVYK